MSVNPPCARGPKKPKRTPPRFSVTLPDDVADQVRAALQAAGTQEGYASVNEELTAAINRELRRLRRKYNGETPWCGVPKGCVVQEEELGKNLSSSLYLATLPMICYLESRRTMSKAKNAPNAAKVKPVYWHGGDAGLTAGDSLLSSNQIPAMKLLYSRSPKEILGTHDPDFAYITTNFGLAFNYALRHAQTMGRPAAVYKVAPSGKPLHDVDYPVGVSFRCRTAVVLGIEGDEVNGDEALSVEGLQANTWHDGTQVYDPEGYPSPNDLQKKFGITRADLRGMGIGAPMADILKTVSEVIQIKNPGITQDEINAADSKFVLEDARMHFNKGVLARSYRR